MTTIKTRIQNISCLIESVKDHCMCAKFEDDGVMYRVIYPEGVQCSQRIGKAVALERLLIVMERHWKESLL